MRAAVVIGLLLASWPALAQHVDLIGRWRNTVGREIEFKQDGTIDIAGIGTGNYKFCNEEGDDLCIDYDQFQCQFHAAADPQDDSLTLVTGRPTKNCPDGRFARIQPKS